MVNYVMQTPLLLPLESDTMLPVKPFKTQLLKWIGNKQRFAHEIASYFPSQFNTYFEPFLGSGAVLGTIRPSSAIASDTFAPLVEIWQMLQSDPQQLKDWYAERWERTMVSGKVEGYEAIKASYNANPNGADLLFLCRSCYGGVVRFRQSDGFMSTPCGVHNPIEPVSFARRVDVWHERTFGANFWHLDYKEAFRMTEPGDLVYCDPPYTYSQTILYGAHSFDLSELFDVIATCKDRGVQVVLSIDGTKKSGNMLCDLPIPDGLFQREILLNCGRSMLKRFQRGGQTVEDEIVADRLLLTY